MDYFDVISQLPLPTPKQTVRFANHVVTSHSWYKHLSLFPPGQTFVLYLNPRAACRVVMNFKGDEAIYTVSEIEGEDNSTVEYRNRFGHWDYFQAGAEKEPWIYQLWEGGPEWVPSEVKQRWSCQLTAFCYPQPTMYKLNVFGAHSTALESFNTYAREHPADPDVVRNLPVVSRIERDGESAWWHNDMLEFMEKEATLQRDRVLQVLIDIRARVSGDPASAQHPAFKLLRPGPNTCMVTPIRQSGRASKTAQRGYSFRDFVSSLEARCDAEREVEGELE
jgi:hypothetical protein